MEKYHDEKLNILHSSTVIKIVIIRAVKSESWNERICAQDVAVHSFTQKYSKKIIQGSQNCEDLDADG